MLQTQTGGVASALILWVVVILQIESGCFYNLFMDYVSAIRDGRMAGNGNYSYQPEET